MVSKDEHTQNQDVITKGQEAYIDVAVVNFGPITPSEGFTVSLYDFDREKGMTLFWEEHFDGLSHNETQYILDVPYTWSDSEEHRVGAEVVQDGVPDDGWQINNNAFSPWFTPQQGTIKYEGYLHYIDKNTGQTEAALLHSPSGV